MTRAQWAADYLGVLKKFARETRKRKPETRQHLCRFFHGLLREYLLWAGLRPEDIGSSEEDLEMLGRGETPRAAKPPERRE